MENISIGALEFQKRFGTEEQCREYLFRVRWPKGFICPNCGHDDASYLSPRQLYQCRLCNYQASVTAGTIFHRTHLPLTCWFWVIYQITHDKGGASATRLASQLHRPYKTMWHVVHKLRYAMGSRDSGITLAGLIELDEAILGPEARRPSRREDDIPMGGRKAPRKKPCGHRPKHDRKRKSVIEVIVAAEAEHFHIGNVAMRVAERVDYGSIEEFAEQKVDPQQKFKTDARHSHWILKYMGHDLATKKSSGDNYEESLPVVHRVISLLKHFLMGTYYGVSTRYLQSYLQEFCFRFIRRDKLGSIHDSLLRACLSTVPMTYAELTV